MLPGLVSCGFVAWAFAVAYVWGINPHGGRDL